jgi:hypothetical protein
VKDSHLPSTKNISAGSQAGYYSILSWAKFVCEMPLILTDVAFWNRSSIIMKSQLENFIIMKLKDNRMH